MLEFIIEYWLDLLLCIVGLSALAVYYFQKRDELYSAGTLITGQIMLVEKCVATLKEDHQLGNIAVYHSKPIIKENMWEQYKHLFAKRLTTPEYEMLQLFFDHAEQLERARMDIISTITNGWRDKSTVEHEEVAKMIQNGATQESIDSFRNTFRPLDLVFTPHVAIDSLTKSLANFSALTGTTAYSKIQKRSYNK